MVDGPSGGHGTLTEDPYCALSGFSHKKALGVWSKFLSGSHVKTLTSGADKTGLSEVV